MGDAKIPIDWEGEYCEFAVCWPNSPEWLAVLRGVLSIPQEGRFWDESTGSIKDAQAVIAETFEFNFDNKEAILTCSSDVSNALLAIASALSSGGGSGSSGGCGCVNFTDRGSNVQIQTTVTLGDGSQVPIFSSGALPVLPEGGVPVGYVDFTAYDADKCAKATKIVNDLVTSLQNFSQVNLAVGVVGAIAILACLVGLIVVPEATVPLLLWAMLANVGLTTAIGLLADYIDDNRDDFICILYTEDNIETMVGMLADLLDVAIAAIAVEGAVAVALKSVVLWLLNGDTLGVLLTSDARNLAPEADCSSCVAEWVMYNGTVYAHPEPNVWVLECDGPVSCGGVTTYNVAGARQMGGSNIPGTWDIQLNDGTITPPGGGGGSCENSWRGVYCLESPIVEFSNVAPTFPLVMSSFTVRSSIPFSLRVTITEEGQVECD